MDDLKIFYDIQKNGSCIARIQGEMAGEDVMKIHDSMLDKIREITGREFFMDFKEAEYIDSAAIGLIFELAQVASERKINVAIVNASDTVKKVLNVTRVNEIVKVY